MIMSWIWTGMVAISLICAVLNRCPQALAASVLKGSQAGVELAISMAGAICLWSGVGKLMEAAGITDKLSRLLRPLLHRVFPSTAKNPALSRSISRMSAPIFWGWAMPPLLWAFRRQSF